MAKSGTHVLASMVRPALRAAHEPQSQELLRLVLHRYCGRLSPEVFTALVAQLIDRQQLDLNVSQINGFIVSTLADSFPRALFILTIRDCESWLRSFINHQLTVALPPRSLWRDFRDLRFQPTAHAHRAEDAALEGRGLYSLNAYLSYWMSHNLRIFRAVPRARLLIVPTSSLQRDSARIARFLGIDSTSLVEPGERFSGTYIPSPIDEMPRHYVSSRVAAATNRLITAAGARIPRATARWLQTIG